MTNKINYKLNKFAFIKAKVIVYLVFVCILFSALAFKPFNFIQINSNSVQVYAEVLDDCELKVHFIDVGQGDSILVELPDNKIMLVDAGTYIEKNRADFLLYMNNFFASREDRVIDYFIATHQHADHIGGADLVFDNFDVINFFRPYVFTNAEMEANGYSTSEYNVCTTKTFETTIAKMKEEEKKGCNVFFNQKSVNPLNLSCDCGYTVEFLSPKQVKYDAPNDYSPITIITYQGRKIMLTGDAQTLVENQVLADYSSEYLDCDILKLGHHGSKTSTSGNFLNAVNPKYVAICCGLNNDYGHPHSVVYNRVVSKVGEDNIYRTDKMSDFCFGIDKDSIVDGKSEIKISIERVDDVKSKIAIIGTVEFSNVCKTKIESARNSYDKLTDYQKSFVDNYQTLVDAENTYSTKKANQESANEVIAKISNIGTVEYTEESKAKINEAQVAYDSLTDEQKSLVNNIYKLEEAKQTYDKLKYDKEIEESRKRNTIIIASIACVIALSVSGFLVFHIVTKKKRIAKYNK